MTDEEVSAERENLVRDLQDKGYSASILLGNPRGVVIDYKDLLLLAMGAMALWSTTILRRPLLMADCDE